MHAGRKCVPKGFFSSFEWVPWLPMDNSVQKARIPTQIREKVSIAEWDIHRYMSGSCSARSPNLEFS
jgi:hypothetical protein